MVDFSPSVTEFIGNLVVYGGGGTALVFFATKRIATTWLDNRFAEKLAAFNSALQRRFDRAQNIHKIEFEVLPKLWGKCAKSFQTCRAFCSKLRLSNDISLIDDVKLKAELKKKGFDDLAIDHVIKAVDKNTALLRISNLRMREIAITSMDDFIDYYQEVKIFLHKNLEQRIDELLSIMNLAIFEAEDRHLNGVQNTPEDSLNDLEKNGKAVFSQISEEIRNQIWVLESSTSPTK